MSEPTETIATVGANPPAAPPPTTGPVRLLVLVAAALGLVLYVIGYFGGLALLNITPVPALLLGGGLLAAATLLPRTGRLLVPAAVAVTVGVLLLMQVVFGLGGLSGGVNSVGRGVSIPTIGIVVVILAFLQLAAVVAALLISVGILRPSSAGGFGQRGGRGRRGEYGQQPPPGYGPGFNPGYGQGAYGPGPGGYPPQGPPGAHGGGPGPYGPPPPGGFAPGGYPPHGQPPPPGAPGYGPPFDPQTGPPSGPLPQGGPVQRPPWVQRPWGEVTDPGMAAVTPADEAPGAAPDSPPPSTPDPAKMTLLDVSPADEEPRSFEPPRAYGARADSAPSALEGTPRDEAHDDAEEQDDRSDPPASLSIETPDRRSTEYIANPRDPDGSERPRSQP